MPDEEVNQNENIFLRRGCIKGRKEVKMPMAALVKLTRRLMNR
jgi:hypothetical protein